MPVSAYNSSPSMIANGSSHSSISPVIRSERATFFQ